MGLISEWGQGKVRWRAADAIQVRLGGGMSYVIAEPEYVAAAAADLGSIGSAISDASSAAAIPTSGVLIPAGADAVSAEVAALFGAHAQEFQAISAQAAAFHNQFVQLMSLGSQQYGLTEAANVSNIQTGTVNLPQQTLGHTALSEGTQVAPTAATVAQTVAISSAAAGPVGSAMTPAAPVGSVGSAVAAGSVGSVNRQPIPSLPASAAEPAEIVQTAPVSALPAPLAARAVPAAALTPQATRMDATGQTAPAAG